MAIVGRVVSAVVDPYVTVSTSVAVLPEVSRAVSVITFVPICSPIEGALHEVVPDAVPLPPLLFDQLTDATPLLSDAVPRSATVAVVDVNDAFAVGEVIEMDGGVESDYVPLVTDHVKVTGADCKTPSNTLAVMENVPVVVGVPEMKPVAVPTNRPGGRPVAL